MHPGYMLQSSWAFRLFHFYHMLWNLLKTLQQFRCLSLFCCHKKKMLYSKEGIFYLSQLLWILFLLLGTTVNNYNENTMFSSETDQNSGLYFLLPCTWNSYLLWCKRYYFPVVVTPLHRSQVTFAQWPHWDWSIFISFHHGFFAFLCFTECVTPSKWQWNYTHLYYFCNYIYSNYKA